MNPNLEQQSEERPCKTIHKIAGAVPQSNNVELDGKTCDCGMLLFKAVSCGCPGGGMTELKSEQNPNYIPS